MVFRPNIDSAVMTMEEMASTVISLGVDKVAEKSGLTERVIRKFTVNVMGSKNSDIAKIKAAVKELSTQK
jgi:hypothetical protein